MGARILLAVLWLLHCLPLGVQAWLGRGLGRLLYPLAKARRRIALRNIALCFPEQTHDEHEALAREHFEWLGPLFNEQLQLKDGHMWLPDRPGLGFSLSEQAIGWRAEKMEFGKRP